MKEEKDLKNENENFWYDVKEINGKISIEKIEKRKKWSEESKEFENKAEAKPIDTSNTPRYVFKEVRTKKKKGKLWICLGLCVFVLAIASYFIFNNESILNRNKSKNRTIMIYMVGSDLESGGKMATYDLNDITSSNVNLEENNVVLMVGGAKKWHNFVNKDEIGVYNLTEDGFNKIKSYNLSSMGESKTLNTFLDYSYQEFPAEKYDLIFWNHGLGSIGIQQDEIYGNMIDIAKLDKAFKNSPFNKEKLELVIFNDCLGGNIHFANIMKKYADYMVASEQSMYVSLALDRLNFLENIKKDDNGYDVGKNYIDQNDKSIDKYKSRYKQELDTTLSIIDLRQIDNLDSKINEFFDSISLDTAYNQISRQRANLYTYGFDHLQYDTVDIYELVEALRIYSNNQTLVSEVKNELKKAIKYNSANDNHSNGLSIYFPYYGNEELIEYQLQLFDKLWKNNYTKFISDFNDLTQGIKRARRVASGSNINKLKNKVATSKNSVILNLNDTEKEKYQRANIYIFEKENEEYKLLLQTNKVDLVDNNLVYNHYAIIKDENNNKLTLIDDNSLKMYASIDEQDVMAKVSLRNGIIEFINFILDTNKVPSYGIVERTEDSSLDIYSLKYDLFEDNILKEDWKETVTKEKVKFNTSGKLTAQEGLKGYYILIEMYDINNDAYYSDIIKA